MRLKWLLIALLALFVFSCASTQEYGVRSNSRMSLEKLKEDNICSVSAPSRLDFELLDNCTVFSVFQSGDALDIRVGDRITAVNGHRVSHRLELVRVVAPLAVGSLVPVTLVRSGKSIEAKTKTVSCNQFYNLHKKYLLQMAEGNWQDALQTQNRLLNLMGSSPPAFVMWDKYQATICNLLAQGNTNPLKDATAGNLLYSACILELTQALLDPHSAARRCFVRCDEGAKELRQNGYVQYAENIRKLLRQAEPAPPEPPTSSSSPEDWTYPGIYGHGSGFSVSPDGLIVTSYHVISEATRIIIDFPDGRRADATIYKTDPANDLAVLKVAVPTVAYLPIAPFQSVHIGEPVFTIGYPMLGHLGREPKFTDGSISALSGLGDAASFLQISVPVHPGNSGSPLVNDKGQVVGVIVATAAVLPFLREYGVVPQNVNWAVKGDYVRLLLPPARTLPPTQSRAQAIKRTEAAICLVWVVH